MRNTPSRWTAAVVLLVLACTERESPTAATPMRSGAPPALAITNPACTVRWAAGVNGNWTDASKWNPVGVPGATSSVCINAAGTYQVTLDPVVDATPVDIVSLDVGGAGANATLRFGGVDVAMNVAQGIVVVAGATVDLRTSGGSVITASGGVMNSGTFTAVAPCGGCGAGNAVNADFDNRGTLSAVSALLLGKVNASYVNTGTITFGNGGGITIPSAAGNPTFVQNAGVISSGIYNFARLTMASGTFTMNGGEAQLRTPANQIPIVVLDGASLVIGAGATGNTALAIRVGVTATPTVTGDIPALTQLWVAGSTSGQSGTVSFMGNPVNFGTIRPQKFFDGLGGDITLGGAGSLRNAGIIDQSRNSGALPTIQYLIELTNDGTMTVTTSHATLGKAAGQYVNNGLIDMGPASSVFILRVPATSTLHHSATGSVIGGTLSIDGGRVFGDGPLNTKVAATNGGVYDPGLSTAVVDVANFVPTTSGVLRVEIGGPVPGAQYDRVNVTGPAVLQGRLDVAVVGGPSAGFCGLRYDVLTHRSGGSAGNFSSYSGLILTPNFWLRPVHQVVSAPAVSTVTLVGFDPTQKVCVGPSAVAVAEGGSSVQYSVVLDHAPTATVTVSASPDAQLSVTPAFLTFNASNWQVPQSFTLIAVDDIAPEGPHTGTVTHAVATTDASFAGFVPGSVTANITDNDINLPPIAGNDAASTSEDIAVVVPVLVNDSDPELATLTVTGATSGSSGTTVVNVNNTVTYTPAADFNGQDIFTYTLSDGVNTSTGTVTVTIAPVNDAPTAANDQATTTAGVPVVISVLANDADIDGDPLTISQVGTPANGTATITGNGQTVTYASSAGFSGQEVFGYTVSDGQGGTATASVTVTVSAAANLPPMAAFTQTCAPQLCTLDASSSTDDQGIVSYQWSAGASGRPNKTGVIINRQYAVNGAPNTWQETLTVTDAQGLSHSVTQTVTIPPTGIDLPPVADFTIACTSNPRRCVLDGSVSTDDIGIVSWRWSAATTGRPAKTGRVIQRSYSMHNPNTWQETLTVTDRSGQTSSITKTVTVP